MARSKPGVVRIGYFGSYARGNWGVGSDLDVVVILENCQEPFERRQIGWDTRDLPVPVDLLIYTAAEWERLRASAGFARTVEREAVWVSPA